MTKNKFFTDVAEEENPETVDVIKHNKDYFDDGGNVESDDEKLQVPYVSASNICTTMDTVVPKSMAVEQRKFNERLKAACAELGMSVEQYVAKKLHYRSVDELCFQEMLDAAGERITRFSAEQIDAIGTAIWNHEIGDNGIIVADQAGSGKGRSQPIDSQVLTPSGFVKMATIKVGDKVISVDGKSTKVLGVFPQGKLEVFEIGFSDGSKTECSADHLWSVINQNKKLYLKKNGSFNYSDCNVEQTNNINIKKKNEIPIVSPVHFKKQKVPVEPYTLGALIGNGCLRTHSIQFITNDEETLKIIEKHLHKSLKIWKNCEHHYNIVQKKMTGGDGKSGTSKNKLMSALRKIDVMGKRSYEKFIPDVYKINSFDIRLSVFQGLMDTDGWAEKDGATYYSTSSKQLAVDIQFLVQSFGGIAKLRKPKRPKFTKYNSDEKKEGRLHYTVSIKLPNSIIPFRLKRKIDRLRTLTKYFPQRIIRYIKPIGKKKCQCIKIAHESSLYVTNDFIVTHNTASGIIRYAILEKKVIPFFFTEKKHLINDIYRDLIAIGFDAGVPYKFRKTIVVEKSEFSDDELLKIIIQDIKDRDDIRIDFSLPEGFNLDYIKRSLDESHAKYDEVEEIKSELIEAYRQHFIENGYEKDVYELNPDYKQQVIEAMRKGKFLIEPFVPNLIDIKDIDGNILYEAITKKEADQIYQLKGKSSADPDLDVTKLSLPSRYKLFAMPYSQVSTGYEDQHGAKVLKNKIKLFQKYAHNSVIILDESHNASGLIRGELTNAGEIIFNLVKTGQMTTYLSATYAKRAENMPLYALKTSIRECGLSDKEMIDTFMNGGNSLQEAVSAELARNGQLLRREKIIQGKSEYYYENEGSETGNNQIAKLDRVAILYNKVLDFSSAVRETIKLYKASLPTKEEKDKIKPARGVNALAFQLFNFMLLGLKIRQTTEFAIKKLQSGRKTVIAVASTMESALDNLSKTFMSNTDVDSYKVGDKIKNDFSLYMAYLLNYTMRYNLVDVKVDSEGNEEETKKLIYVLGSNDELSTLIKDALLNSYQNTLKEILDFETGIPIAPLDMIEKNIKDAGFSISEITGRQRKIVFEEDTNFGIITKREIKKTDIVVREFNENEIDCLVINQSGATGISMHSLPNKKANIVYQVNEDGTENAPTSLENKKEVKRRAMVITQMELDINKEVQKIGRINRMGQVYQPEYTYVISAIPSESRLTSLMEKKLRSLSANVSSNQQQASYLFTADDFFSDIAVSPFNETMNDVGMRGQQVTTGSQIQDFTKTLYFKDFKLQKDFYDTFSKKLQQEIITLSSQGLYTGKMTHKDYFAETIIKHPFYIGDNNAKTSFGRHSFIEKCTVKLFKEKFTEKKISNIITDGLKIKTSNDEVIGKEDLFFSNVPAFQKKAIETLNNYEIQKRDLIEKSNQSIDEEIKEYQSDLKTVTEKLSGFNELTVALQLESDLKQYNSAIENATFKITAAAKSGDMESVTSQSLELNKYHALKKETEEKLKPFNEILKTRGEHRNIEREVKQLNYDVERSEKKKLNNEKQMNEYSKLISDAKTYLSKIGQIVQLDVYDLKITYDEDSVEDRIVEFNPTIKFSHPVVVTGVSFPHGYYDLTPGKFEIHFCGVSEKFTYNLYKLEKTNPHEADVQLSILAGDYKDKWNQIAGKSDNTYKENRYIIIGSLLKTFALGKSNEISGQIIKYNTIDGKHRIGIEIADNEDNKNGRKSVYKILEERYGNETALQHPIYYDGNSTNVKKFIEEYIYHYMFGEAYNKIENKITPEEGTFQPIHSQYDNLEFIFQISSVDRSLFVVAHVDYTMRDESNTLHDAYNKKSTIPKKISVDDLLKTLSVKIISDSINATDFLAYHLNVSTGTEITPDNYEMAGKSKNFKNVSVYRSKKIGTLRLNRGAQFKTFFPTNIISLEGFLNYGISFTSRLKMSYDNFIKLIDYLTVKRMRPTFATASEYFNKHKGDYIFEQFLDDVETETPTDKKIVQSVDFTESINTEINELIDELVNALTTES